MRYFLSLLLIAIFLSSCSAEADRSSVPTNPAPQVTTPNPPTDSRQTEQQKLQVKLLYMYWCDFKVVLDPSYNKRSGDTSKIRLSVGNFNDGTQLVVAMPAKGYHVTFFDIKPKPSNITAYGSQSDPHSKVIRVEGWVSTVSACAITTKRFNQIGEPTPE